MPAPCTYNNSEEIGKNLEGKYHLSKYRNSKAKIFNLPRSKRFNKSSIFYNDAATDVPGPGDYKPQNDLSSEGKYVLSKNVSAGKRTFMDGRRLSFTDLAAKKRASSNCHLIQLLDLVATVLLPISAIMIVKRNENQD